MKNHNIILLVDTATIIDHTEKCIMQSLDNYCHFAGQEANSTIELYTTKVRLKDSVTWLGLSNSSDTQTVSITKIAWEAGTELLDGTIEIGNNVMSRNRRGKIEKGKPDQWEKYNIQFVIMDEKKEYGPFLIDPLMQVHKKKS